VKQALQEYPGDAEMVELERLARQGHERETEARRLSEQGQRECAAGNHEAGLAALRQAYGLDERNGALRDALLQNLVEQARRLMDENRASAETYLKQALELEPEHALVKGLANMFQDRRRQEEIEHLVAQARQLQADGDIRGAMDVIRAGLTKYPNDPRISQLQQSLGRRFQEIRRKDLDEFRRIEQESHGAADAQAMADYSLRLDGIAKRYEGDAEFQSSAHALRRRLETVMMPPPAGTAPAPVPVPAVPPTPGPELRPDPIAETPAEGLGPPAPAGRPRRGAGRPQWARREAKTDVDRNWSARRLACGLESYRVAVSQAEVAPHFRSELAQGWRDSFRSRGFRGRPGPGRGQPEPRIEAGGRGA
jgi:tetratricopeptide (TPR) repeat protein